MRATVRSVDLNGLVKEPALIQRILDHRVRAVWATPERCQEPNLGPLAKSKEGKDVEEKRREGWKKAYTAKGRVFVT